MLWLQWALCVHLPWSWDRSSPWLSILTARESQLLCLLNQRFVLFKVELQHTITCVPQRWWNSFCLEKISWPICYPSKRLMVLLLPTTCVQTRVRPCNLPRILLIKSTSLVVQGKNFWSERNRCIGLSFWLDSLVRVILNH